MNHAAHFAGLDAALRQGAWLWQPQPFREPTPAWCAAVPALDAALLALDDEVTAQLNDDSRAALRWLSRFQPGVAALLPLLEVPVLPSRPVAPGQAFWDWEIPGRKRAQIEAFAAATTACGQPLLDWCGGKGHLGRLLALGWQLPVHSLDVDAQLCADGRQLAARAGAEQQFVEADALSVTDWPRPGQHAVALHACGELHRRLIRQGAAARLPGLDVAPCCYYRGVAAHYTPLSGQGTLLLTRDDTRLAVTETVTAKGGERRQRDRALAWKLGFDAWRRTVTGAGYQPFKPVPERWLRASFAEFMAQMTVREGLPAPSARQVDEFEQAGWQRQRTVMRHSIVRHAFRRALELWLVLDLAVYLEQAGYAVRLGTFCDRALTPRNLLVSART